MTAEIHGLTLEAIDTLIASVKRTSGLITDEYRTTKGVCVLGSLGCDGMGRFRKDRADKIMNRLGINANYGPGNVAVMENDDFDGTPLQRKRHMLKWLRAQRAFKKAKVKG